MARFSQGRFAVLGGGESGRAAKALLEKLGATHVVVYSEQGEADAEVFESGKEDWVVVSPGFPPHHMWLKKLQRGKVERMGELDLAARVCQGQVLAVTGTNGKTTLATLLYRVLKGLGQSVWLCGNGHAPFSKVALEGGRHGKFVCEVSSFQASGGLHHFAPSALFWTNFTPDHLDYHLSEKAYFEAKWHLVEALKRKGGRLFCPSSLMTLFQAQGKKVPSELCWAKSAALEVPDLFQATPLKETYVLAATYCQNLKGGLSQLKKVAANWQGLPHRLELVGEKGHIRVYNDAKATNVAACLAGLKGMRGGNCPLIWIGGGTGKGNQASHYADLAKYLLERRCAAFLAHADPTFVAALRARVEVKLSENLEEATHKALLLAEKWAIDQAAVSVVFSPAAASWPAYKNYLEKGESFKTCVKTWAGTRGS